MLSWNVTNWVTVLLMVGLGFAIIHFGAQAVMHGKTAIAKAPGMSNIPGLSS